MTIRTDNRWKQFKYGYEVPKKVLQEQFDYMDDAGAQDGFFKYKGWWYHLDDFMRVEPNSPFKGWDGYRGDSYFSGVLIKVSNDGEEYKVATYFS